MTGNSAPRRYHLLSANHSSQRPTSHLFVDIESRLSPDGDDRTTHTLWFGWAIHWERRGDNAPDTLTRHRFTTESEFWALVVGLIHPKHPLYLVTHNVNYDLGVLDCFTWLASYGMALESIYLGGMTSIIQFSDGERVLHVLDNANLFPCSLAELGENLGFAKLDVDPLTATEQEADPYCLRDAEILQRAWATYYDFLDEHDLGNWGKTTPSQAFNAYRHRFMHHDIHIHDRPDLLEMEREAYHGGRCSTFYRGTLRSGPYYYLDVNSMYPAVMAAESYPVKAHYYQTAVSLSRLEEYLSKYAVVARVRVRTDEPVYMVSHHGHMVHPTGEFVTTLCTPELKYALDHGDILEVLGCARYDQAPLFESYVDYFYKLKAHYKKTGETAFYYMVKLFLNSLYGKFGQRSKSLERYEPEDQDFSQMDHVIDAATGTVKHIYTFGDTRWIYTDEGEAYNSFPAIAAHVTAYARMMLWSYIQTAGRDHVYYTDTDSLIVDAMGYARLSGALDEQALGTLKIEQVADTVTLRAPKCYTFGEITRRKGVPGKAEQTGPDAWTFQQFPSFRRQGKWGPGESYHTTTVTRRLSYVLYDGVQTPSGWVKPMNALDLGFEQRLTREDQDDLLALDQQLDALKESGPVSASVVFRLWDHKRGTWRRMPDRLGNLVALEYSQADSLATELGFDDLSALQEGVLRTLEVWAQMRELREKRAHLIEGSEPQVLTEPLPF